MIVTWMAYGLVVGAFLAAAAHCLEWTLKLVRKPVRAVPMGALLGLVLLVILVPARASDPATATGPTVSPGPTAVAASGVESTGVIRAAASAVSSAATWSGPASEWQAEARKLDSPLAVSWALLTATLLGLMAWTLARSRRMRRRWAEHDIEGGRVRVSHDAGPAVVGVLRPEIVIPNWLLAASTEQLRIALEHEREHVRRRDPLLLGCGWLLLALVPWNPFAWWLFTRLRLAVELDCDARVLGRGAGAFAYGSLLLDVAARSPRPLVGATGIRGKRSHLERRLHAMNLESRRRAPARGSVFAVLSFGLVVAACALSVPTAAEIESMDVAAMESRAAELVSSGSEELVYVLDGVVVEATEARAVPSDAIARIEVVRGTREAAGQGQPAVARVIEIRRFEADAAGIEERAATVARRAVTAADRPAASGGPRIFVDGVEVVPAESRGSPDRPLLIVDGVIVEDEREARVDTRTIEAVEVIKGGAATRLFGARAAAGVIRVRTADAPDR